VANGLKRLPARFYRPSDSEPVREWIQTFEPQDRTCIGEAIAKVEFGWPVGMPVCRSLEGEKDLWEVPSGYFARQDDWLKKEGIYEEVTAAAIKHVIAWQIEQAMKEQQLSKTEMARRMHTSRAALDRLLDPQNDAVTLNTLYKAATAIGRQVRLELV
jgi:hypothetical protein